MNKKKYLISEEVLVNIANYLSKQPFVEVDGLMQGIKTSELQKQTKEVKVKESDAKEA